MNLCRSFSVWTYVNALCRFHFTWLASNTRYGRQFTILWYSRRTWNIISLHFLYYLPSEFKWHNFNYCDVLAWCEVNGIKLVHSRDLLNEVIKRREFWIDSLIPEHRVSANSAYNSLKNSKSPNPPINQTQID